MYELTTLHKKTNSQHLLSICDMTDAIVQKTLTLTYLVLPEAFQVRFVIIVQMKKSGTVKSTNLLKIANLLSGKARLQP